MITLRPIDNHVFRLDFIDCFIIDDYIADDQKVIQQFVSDKQVVDYIHAAILCCYINYKKKPAKL